MVRQYRFAGVEIAVDIPENKMYQDEYRLKNFAVNTTTNPHIFQFEMRNILDKPEGNCLGFNHDNCVYQDGKKRIRYVGTSQHTLEGAYIRVESVDHIHKVQLLNERFPNIIGTKTVVNSLDVSHILAEVNAVILHCSYIEINGKAILFTAPSETGKSTQADLWYNHRGATIVNGDRAAVRIVGNQIIAEGLPFAGSSQYCRNHSLPVEAIVYLGQAPLTSICHLEGYKAFSKLWEGISLHLWDKKDVEIVSAVVQKIVETIPIFYLNCTPDESAVIALENMLRKTNVL